MPNKWNTTEGSDTHVDFWRAVYLDFIDITMASSCLFKSKFNCGDGNLTTAGPARIQTIVKFSKEYKDDFYLTLEEKLRDDRNVTIGCHRNCVNIYFQGTIR